MDCNYRVFRSMIICRIRDCELDNRELDSSRQSRAVSGGGGKIQMMIDDQAATEFSDKRFVFGDFCIFGNFRSSNI